MKPLKNKDLYSSPLGEIHTVTRALLLGKSDLDDCYKAIYAFTLQGNLC